MIHLYKQQYEQREMNFGSSEVFTGGNDKLYHER